MKKFSLVILDDENQHTKSGGWKRVFDLFLIPKNYLMKGSSDITLSDSSTFIENTKPLEVQFFKPENDNYSAIYDRISKKDFQEKKDIYFIDMNWENEDSVRGTNILVNKLLEDVDLEEITDGKLPSELAGLNLLNILPKNDKPKIVFSASNRTKNIRKVFQLLSNRVLTDDILIGEMTGGGSNNYIDEVEQKVDTYIQSRQIAIITRQTADKIQVLSKIVENWNGKVENADEPVIPDNGSDTNPENCWSLRTLFPKQVNRIELGIDTEENKAKIFETIGSLNFPSIYKFLVHDHGNLNGLEYEKVKNESIVINRFHAIKDLEFIVTEKIPYVKFSEVVPNQTTYDHKAIRRVIYDKVDFDIQDQVVYKECSGKLEEKEPLKIMAGLMEDGRISQAIRKMAEYGLYIGDLQLIYGIIESNAKYNYSDTYKQAHSELPEPKLTISYLAQEVIVNISYDSDEEYYNDSQKNIEPVYKGVENLLKNKQSWKIIDQLGPTQIFKILAYRYNTELEVRVGKLSFSAGRFGITNIKANDDGNKTYFQFKLPTQMKS
jgi:hypothetical protein